MIIADHGNAEELLNHGGEQMDTEHSANPVPLIVVGEKWRKFKLNSGVLGDVAPTILMIMGVKQPVEMSGRCLFAG